MDCHTDDIRQVKFGTRVSGYCVDVRLPRNSPFAQAVFVETGDALIALGKRDEFVAADDIVDAREGLVSGTEKYFAQNGVGRVFAVG
jgi:hypothetical protein